MTAHDFLERLEKDNLVDRALVAALRRKVSQPGKELSAQKVAKYLVSNGHITQADADSCLAAQAPAMRELTEDDLIGGHVEEQPTKTKSRKSKRKSKSKPAKEESLAMLTEEDVVEEEVVDLAAATAAPAEMLPDLDDLGDMDPLGVGGGGLDEEPEKEEKKDVKSFSGKYVVDNQWDSKWIFIGPTVIVVLAIAAAFIYLLLTRGDATKNWEAFLDSYRGQRYTEAIERGDLFLEKFPKDENAESVKVYRGIARIRIPVEGKDWERSLEQLEKVLPTIKDSEKLADVQDDIPYLILTVAEGFANNAERAAENDIGKAESLVKQAEQTMELTQVSEYIPSSERRKPVNEAHILRVSETIERVKYSINMERTLVSTLLSIDEALDKGDTVNGFDLHKQVIRAYPQLESDERLYEAVLKVSDMERALVRVSEDAISPSDRVDNPAIVGAHVVTTQVGTSISSLDGEVVPLLLNGSVFAINAGDGRVMWRKYMGIATEYQPQWVDTQLREHLLLINSEEHSLMRVDASTGDVVWTVTIGEPFAEPIIASGRAYLALRAGHLVELDLSDGSSSRRVQVPQALLAGPATGPRSKFLFQPGLHSNIYKLSATSLECQEVYYLGHAQGAVSVPPVMASGYLFIAENFPAGSASDEYCQIHVLLPNTDGIVSVQTPIRLEGKVVSPMVLYQRKVLVVTDLGDIALLDVDVTSESRPVTAVAQFKLKSNPQLKDFYAADNGRLFVADEGITGFSIQAQRGALDRKTATNSGDVFVAPIHIFGDYVIHARIRAGSTLVSVSAVRVEESESEIIWRSDLAAPLAGTPILDETTGQVTAVSAQGDQFVLDETMLDGFSDQDPTRRGSTTLQDLVFHYLIDLGEGKAIGFGPGQLVEQQGVERRQLQLLAIDPSQQALASRIYSRPVLYEDFTTAPIRFGDGVLLPSAAGQVFYIDPINGRDVTTPFQPAIEPGNSIIWCRPEVIDNQNFVVADARGVIYRVALDTSDGGALRKADELRYENKFVSPLAVEGQAAFVVAQAGAGHELLACSTSPLEVSETKEMPGRVTAGPFAANGHVLVALEDRKLYAYSPSLEEQWSVDIGANLPVGSPVQIGDDLLIAMNRGIVLRVNATTGEVVSTIDAGEPITHPPIPMGDRLIIGTWDGTVKVLNLSAD